MLINAADEWLVWYICLLIREGLLLVLAFLHRICSPDYDDFYGLESC